MNKQQLIAENENLRAALEEIRDLTDDEQIQEIVDEALGDEDGDLDEEREE